MTTQQSMGLRIKKLREHKKMSQSELAEKVGYKDKTAVAKVEAGKVDLPQTKIELFATVLETTPSELLGWSDTITDADEDVFYQYKFQDNIIKDYVQEVGEFLYHNPNHKKLFDASMRVSNEDIELAKKMLDKISGFNDHCP